jgi:hypothetical protein
VKISGLSRQKPAAAIFQGAEEVAPQASKNNQAAGAP